MTDPKAETPSLSPSPSPSSNAPNDLGRAALQDAYDKQARQLNRLTKLADSTQAKLTDANQKMESLLRNLQRYVPAAVVEVLMESGTEQLPTNSREKITVFFSDIVGFTTITERLDPERLASLMTEYFTEMAEICSKWGGTLDQFIGDAIVIFFGAPRSQGTEEDAQRALSMALDMQDRLRALRLKWSDQGLSLPFDVRMGISTGYCNVGNFGSHERLHYTAIGTAVNSAARIQSMAAPNTILIAEDTYMLVRDVIKCSFAQTAILQGQKHPTNLFQPADDQAAIQASILTANEAGMRFYFDPAEIQDNMKAKELLKAALRSIDEQPADDKSDG